LEIRGLDPSIEAALADFLEHLKATGADKHFHPHPLDRATAAQHCCYSGHDLYCVAILEGRVVAYGMLRGWDAGFAIPSLGIAVRSEHRGTGLARLLMCFLHYEAARRGATRVRLRVNADNARALALYRSLGYEFEGVSTTGELIAFKSL